MHQGWYAMPHAHMPSTKQHEFSIAVLFSSMVGLISSLLITQYCQNRIGAVTIAPPATARSWSLDPADACRIECMHAVRFASSCRICQSS